MDRIKRLQNYSYGLAQRQTNTCSDFADNSNDICDSPVWNTKSVFNCDDPNEISDSESPQNHTPEKTKLQSVSTNKVITDMTASGTIKVDVIIRTARHNSLLQSKHSRRVSQEPNSLFNSDQVKLSTPVKAAGLKLNLIPTECSPSRLRLSPTKDVRTRPNHLHLAHFDYEESINDIDSDGDALSDRDVSRSLSGSRRRLE